MGPVSSVALSKDGKRIVSGSYDNLVKIWDAATGAEVSSCVVLHLAKRGGLPESGVRWQVCTLTGHTDVVTQVTFSDDGAQAISGSRDGTVRGVGTREGQGGMLGGVRICPWYGREGLTWVGCAGALLGRHVRHAGARGRWR